MLYYVTLRHAQGKFASMVVDVPEDYDFMQDMHLPSRTAHFKQLKKLCQEQCPSGYHDAFWMLRGSEFESTQVIAVSRLQ